jgi:hypothetical protein
MLFRKISLLCLIVKLKVKWKGRDTADQPNFSWFLVWSM